MSNALENQFEERINVKNGSIYSSVYFKPNDFIFEFTGESISQNEAFRRSEKYASSQTCLFFYKLNGEELCIDASVSGNIGRFLSTSNTPNCYSDIFIKDNKPHLVILANDIIKKKQKITINIKLCRSSIIEG